jgi:DNA-binding NtrC family response regulator
MRPTQSTLAPRDGRQRATVLVVEDEALIRRYIADELRDCHWRVLEAESGDKARLLFTAGEPIDLVFSDVQMPGEMNGIDLAHWVHDHHPDVHVLLASSIAALSAIPAQVCSEASIFRKPYDGQAIAARIHALMG